MREEKQIKENDMRGRNRVWGKKAKAGGMKGSQ